MFLKKNVDVRERTLGRQKLLTALVINYTEILNEYKAKPSTERTPLVSILHSESQMAFGKG